jgi:hypothetical protein
MPAGGKWGICTRISPRCAAELWAFACAGIPAPLPMLPFPRPLPSDRAARLRPQAEFHMGGGYPPEDYYDDYDGAPWEGPSRAYSEGYIPYPAGHLPHADYYRHALGRGDPYGPPRGHPVYRDYVGDPRVRGAQVQQRVMRPASAQPRSLSWTDVDVVNSNSNPARDPPQRPYHAGGREKNHYPAVRGSQPVSCSTSGPLSRRPMSAGPARRPAIFTKNRVHPVLDDGGQQEQGPAVSREDFESRPTSALINSRPSSAISRGSSLMPENSEVGSWHSTNFQAAPSRALSGGSISAEDRRAGDAGEEEHEDEHEDEQRVSCVVLHFNVHMRRPLVSWSICLQVIG